MKYVLIILGILIIIPAFVWIIGSFLPQSHTATVSKKIDTTRGQVWNAITSVNDYPDWRSDLSKVEILSDSTEKLKWREYYDNGDIITFEETGRVDSTQIEVVIADLDLPFGGTWTYQIEQFGDGTKLTITEEGEIYNPIFRFISYFFMSETATMEQYLSDLENHLR